MYVNVFFVLPRHFILSFFYTLTQKSPQRRFKKNYLPTFRWHAMFLTLRKKSIPIFVIWTWQKNRSTIEFTACCLYFYDTVRCRSFPPSSPIHIKAFALFELPAIFVHKTTVGGGRDSVPKREEKTSKKNKRRSIYLTNRFFSFSSCTRLFIIYSIDEPYDSETTWCSPQHEDHVTMSHETNVMNNGITLLAKMKA